MATIVRRKRRWRLVVMLSFGAAVLIPLVWYYAFLTSELAEMEPPAPKCTFEAFLKHVPFPQQFRVFETDGVAFLEVVGQLPNMLTLPSGPPSYVFDRSGILVDWTYDTGEDPDYLARWRAFGSARAISLDDARAWMRHGHSGHADWGVEHTAVLE